MKEDWVEKELGEICDFLGGGTPSKSNPSYWGGDIPWASIKDIKNDQLLKTQDFITKNGLQNSASNMAKSGEIILATRINPGKPILTKIDTAINQDLKIVKPKVEIDTKYLFYGFKTLEKQVLQISSGTTVLGVNLTNLKSLLFPLAPLPIQRAIVSKIETLFSALDKGIEDLNLAKAQLKVYRQAVLKKAFEGELTKEWREKQTNLPTAEELLEQIKVERQKDYEQQLEDWKKESINWEKNVKDGKRPIKPQANKEFKPLTKDEIRELPPIPSNWSWGKFGNLCLKIMDGTHFSPKNISEGDYKYISAKNIKEGRIDLSKISYVTSEDHREIYSRCDVKKGDVLYIKDGATTGRAAVNNLDEEFSLLSSVGVFRTSHNLIVPKFLEFYLNTQVTRNRMLSKIAGVAITRLTLVKLNNSTMLICSPEEQHQIVREIESRLSVCDQVERSINES
jgi:type I restriction enzyme S subunit